MRTKLESRYACHQRYFVSRLALVASIVLSLHGLFYRPPTSYATTVPVSSLPVGSVTEFHLPTPFSGLQSIVAGPDGNLWFTESDNNKIGRITPAGGITEYQLPAQPGGPAAIVAGSDGNLWFTDYFGNRIGRIDRTGTVTEFQLQRSSDGSAGIAEGPDGNLWFTEHDANQIGRITPTGSVTEYPLPSSSAYPFGIVAGPDGNLWFTERNANKIGRITPKGSVTEYPLPEPPNDPYVPPLPKSPTDIVAGPDGNLWFTEYDASQIGRITPAGNITEYQPSTVDSEPIGIAAGSDDNLWFMETNINQIGRITPTGSITEYSSPVTQPYAITAGPDGNLWFTGNADTIVRFEVPHSAAPPRTATLTATPMPSDSPIPTTTPTVSNTVAAAVTVVPTGTASRTSTYTRKPQPVPPKVTPFRLDSTFVGSKPETWPTGGLMNYGMATRQGGRYLLRAADGYFTFSEPRHAPSLANGQISVVVRAQGKGEIGVMARQSGPKNEWNLYACWITNTRQDGCTLWRNGTPQTLASPRLDARIAPDHDNTLLLKLVGNQLTFTVNGRTVYHAAERSPLPAGGWGVYVASRFGTGPVIGSYSRITINSLPARAGT